ncbi:MAG: Pathogenesis-related transcriptional factor and ERF protein [Chitinophagales bacterium]|nr:Pathogenesis-related transcriptional factor and ERF protein [Chitinophagales bacterium]
MYYKLGLKNSEKKVIISDDAFNYIENNEYLRSINLLKNLRLHSNGYAFFQKNFPKSGGGYKSLTIYMHKLIAERFIEKPESEKKLNVTFKDGDKLNCRTTNLMYADRSHIVRNTAYIGNKNGYRGVTKEKNGYRAAIYIGKKRIEIGVFKTAEEAALAYNNKSVELFGKSRSLNKIPRAVLAKMENSIVLSEAS